MGKGKGSVQFWVCPINPGQILFEINGGISKQAAKQVLERARQKLPVKTQFTSYTTASLNPRALHSLPLENRVPSEPEVVHRGGQRRNYR